VSFGSKCSVMGAPDGEFRLKMYCHGRSRPECLGSKCSTMGAQTGEFWFKMYCHGRFRPVGLGSKYSKMGGTDRCVQNLIIK